MTACAARGSAAPTPDPEPAGESSSRRPSGGRLRREAGWAGAALGVVAVVWGLLLVHDHRYFFSGDTQQAYYGWWYAVGSSLRHGHLALLDPSQLMYGDHVVDAQLGLYNPVIGLIGLGSLVAPQLVVYATALKLTVAAVGVLGCYLLARDYRVPPPLAAASAVAVALCGFTYSLSAPRWFDGQLGVALLPWAWWATRRLLRGRSPFPALVACYLVVTVGYIYPTLYLGVVFVVCGLEVLLSPGRRGLLRLVLLGLFCALVAVLVYLPALQSAGFTIRSGGGFSWDGSQKLHWWQVPMLYQPVGYTSPPLFSYSTWSPVEYVVWWLPLLILVEWRGVRDRWRELLPLAVGALAWLLWSLGPAVVGPLRWPARSLEALSLMLAVLGIVALARGITRRPSRRRLALVAAFVVVTEAAMALWHHHEAWARLASGVALIAGLLLAGGWARDHRRLGAVLVVGSLAFGIVTAVVPKWNQPTWNVPSDKAAYARYAAGSRGTILQIDAYAAPDYTYDRGRRLLRGTLWTLTGKSVVNGYTTAEPAALFRKFGNEFNGSFAPGALSQLLETEPTTGKSYLDLFGISTVLLERGWESGWSWRRPPDGWHVAHRDRMTVMWVRDHPVQLAGGVVWSSPGTSVDQVARGPLGVTFRVTGVPAGGGSVVLSRIAYPGYQVSGTASGASLADPLEGYLLRVDVPPGAEGRTVSVGFRPPGWHLEVACAGLAGVLAVAWSGLWLWHRRRPSPGRRRRLRSRSGRAGSVPE